MNDYQPVYDAIRSRFHGDFLGIFERAIRDGFDFGHARMMLQEQISATGYEMQRPSAIFRPQLFIDGNMWCALYGDDLMSGCAGFGETPEKAMRAFDQAWHNETPPVKREDASREQFDNSKFGVGA